jgi:prevent-host-death family protein
MGTQFVSATEFKAKCLSLLDEVASKGGTITVTKRGRPVATVTPVKQSRFPSSEGILKGKIYISDALLNAGLSDERDAVRKRKKPGL